MVWIIPIVLSLALMAVSAFVQFFMRAMFGPSNYDQPNIGNIDPGLQFSEQYNSKTSQTSVPMIFGTVRVTGNIIYENIGGSNNDVLYTCVGLGEASMVQSIDKVIVDEFEWDELPKPVRDVSVKTEKPDGGIGAFSLSSSGAHGFGLVCDAPLEEASTYKIQVYGATANVLVRSLVVKGVENFNGDYSIYYRKKDDVDWTLLVNRIATYSRWS